MFVYAPVIYFSQRAKRSIFAEVSRWARIGLEEEGIPYEAIVYPLSTFLPIGKRLSYPSPLETTSIRDVYGVLVSDAVTPPDEIKRFSAYNCHFQADPAMQQAFNAEIEARIQQTPSLAVLSKLHSHPFPSGDFLSSGDLAQNVFHSNAIRWRERLGMEEALLHVVYPRRPVREIVGFSVQRSPIESEFGYALREEEREARGRGPQEDEWRHHADKEDWGIASFAVNGRGSMVRLQGPIYLDDDDPRVQRSIAAPYWASEAGKAWDAAQKASLAQAGLRPSRGLLGRGWRRYIVSPEGSRDLVFCLPPDFPLRQMRILRIVDASRNLFEKMPLPRSIQRKKNLAEIDLVELSKYCARLRRASPLQ